MNENGLNIYQRIVLYKNQNKNDKIIETIIDYITSFESLFIGGDKKLVEDRKKALMNYAIDTNEILPYPEYSEFINFLVENPVYDLIENDKVILNSIPSLNGYVFQQLKSLKDLEKLSDAKTNEYLINSLTSQISNYIRKDFLGNAINYECKVLEENGYSEGKADFKTYFILEITKQPEWLSYFFSKYPVLIPPIVNFIKNQTKYIGIFLEHLFADAEDIQGKFDIKVEGEIKGISLFNNALRNNNSHVIIVETKQNEKLVYKPKDYKTETFFQETIHALGDMGMPVELKFPKGIDRSLYSWVEFVDVNKEHCENLSEVNKFFYTQGQMLFIFYLFNSYDIGSGNILCIGNKPCFIDLEGLFLREINFKDDDHLLKAIDKKMGISVAHIGMLPKIAIDENNLNTRVKSALTSKKSHNNHLPVFEGASMSGEDFIEDILSGFDDAYNFCTRHGNIILNLVKDKLAEELYLRKILRSSSVYFKLQEQYFHPVNLTDGLKASRIYDHFWAAHGEEDYNGAIVESEIRQLINSDVPVYAVNTLSNILYDGKLKAVSSLKFKSTVISDLEEKINQLSEDDLNFQFNIIKGSFTLMQEHDLQKV